MKSHYRFLFIGVVVITGMIAGVFVFQSLNQSKVTSEDIQTIITPPATDERVALDPQNAQKIQIERSNESPYIPFTKQEYETAKAAGKLIILDFYADWCPICRAEAPEIIAAFSELKDARVVGFRVNFKDGDTDDTEKALAKEFNVPYQHTKIILKNGKEAARYPDQWDKQTALGAIRKELN